MQTAKKVVDMKGDKVDFEKFVFAFTGMSPEEYAGEILAEYNQKSDNKKGEAIDRISRAIRK